MQHRALGRAGSTVSMLALESEVFGAWGNKDHDGSIRHALDTGIDFVDTADLYGHGEAEEIVGRPWGGPAATT